MHIVRDVNASEKKNITCGIMRKLTGSKDFSGMDFVHVTIRDSTKQHYHKKLTEVYYVLKGSINITVDGKTERLKPGQMIMIFPKTKHKATKTSKEDAEILVVCCPPWSEEDEILSE
jgi:mannose-6-phosphate isomerase-like protein (cupin superfamily)